MNVKARGLVGTEENDGGPLTKDVGGEDERALAQGQNKPAYHAGRPSPTQGGENHDDKKKGGVGRETGRGGGTEGKELYRDWETDRKSTRLNSSH